MESIQVPRMVDRLDRGEPADVELRAPRRDAFGIATPTQMRCTHCGARRSAMATTTVPRRRPACDRCGGILVPIADLSQWAAWALPRTETQGTIARQRSNRES
jgi:hypothetical protein